MAAAPSCDEVVQEPPGRGPAALRAGLASPIDWGSPGLGGLAAALASRGKDRLALHAVVKALLAAGIGEPADLALVGSGDDLPQDAVNEILHGVSVPGAEAALGEMFRAARLGLDGSVAIMARRLRPAVQAPSRAPPVEAARVVLAGSKAQCHIGIAAFGPPPMASKR